MRLRPDPATLHRVGAVARVACTVRTPDGQPWPADPRTALVAMVAPESDGVGRRAGRGLDGGDGARVLPARTARHGEPEPVDRAGYFDDAEGVGMRRGARRGRSPARHGIDVTSCHHEAGPGQYELDLAPLGPVALADALVLAKQTVRELAADEGLTATFMPRPFDGDAGSGLHLHQHVAGLVGAGQRRPDRGRCRPSSPAS